MSKSFRTASLLIILASAVLGLVFTRIPLLNIIGYETGAAMGIFMALVGSVLGIIAGHETRAPGSGGAHGSIAYAIYPKYLKCLLAGLAALTIPFVILAVNTYFIKKCNLGPGVPIFLLIAIPTLIHFAAAGLFLGRWISRWWLSAPLLVTYVLVSAFATLLEALAGPRFVFHNLVLGLVSMTGFNGYGFATPESFYYFRGLVVFSSLFFLGAALLLNPEGRKVNRADRIMGAGKILGVLIFLAFCILKVPDATGLGSGQRTLDSNLSRVYNTPNSAIHYSPGPGREKEIEEIAKSTEWYLYEIREALNMEQKWKAEIYLYKDADEMEEFTYARNVNFSQPWKSTLHIDMMSASGTILKHELVHVLMGEFSESAFGVPLNMGLVEGIAMAVENDYFRGAEFQTWFAAALQAGVISSAEKSISNTGFGASNMFKSYDMAGGFVGFLLWKYGPDMFKEYYSSDNAPAVYGKSLKQLNEEWTGWLSGVEVSEYELKRAAYMYDDTTFPAFYKTNCPRVGDRIVPDSPMDRYGEFVENRKNEEAANLCEEMYVESGNPEWLVRQGWRYAESDRIDMAINSADRALSAKKISPETKTRAFILKAYIQAESGSYGDSLKTLREWKAYGFSPPEKIEMYIRMAEKKGIRNFLLAPMIYKRNCCNRWVFEDAIREAPEFGLLYYLLSEADKDPETPYEDYMREKADLINKFAELSPGLEKTKFQALQDMGDEFLNAEMYEAATDVYVKMAQFANDEKQQYIVRRNLEKVRFMEGLEANKLTN